MKGLILLFLVVAGFGILWGYLQVEVRKLVLTFIGKNLFPIMVAILVVTIAIVLSVNTTLRFV